MAPAGDYDPRKGPRDIAIGGGVYEHLGGPLYRRKEAEGMMAAGARWLSSPLDTGAHFGTPMTDERYAEVKAEMECDRLEIEAWTRNEIGDDLLRFAEEFVGGRTPAEVGMAQHMRAAARRVWYRP